MDREPTAYLFSPKQAERERNLVKKQQRKTTMTPSDKKRNRKKHPRKSAGDHYDTASYRRAIKYGIAQLDKHGREVNFLYTYYDPNCLHRITS